MIQNATKSIKCHILNIPINGGIGLVFICCILSTSQKHLGQCSVITLIETWLHTATKTLVKPGIIGVQ